MTTTKKTDKLPATQAAKPPLTLGGRVMPIVPQDIEQAFRLATAIASANMAPKSYNRDANAIMIGIVQGMEVGLTPMAALQSIAVINGMPSIWGDGALAVVRASGLMTGIREWIEGEGDDRVAHCQVMRDGDEVPIERTFSIADAKTAGLFDKSGPWKQYPQRMLQMRARSWALRDAFPDALRGLSIREETQDIQEMVAQPDGSYAADVPAERPQRADYEAEAGETEEAEGWPLYDAQGDNIVEETPAVWMNLFFNLIEGCKEGDNVPQFIRNNYDAGADIASQGLVDMDLRGFQQRLADLGWPPEKWREDAVEDEGEAVDPGETIDDGEHPWLAKRDEIRRAINNAETAGAINVLLDKAYKADLEAMPDDVAADLTQRATYRQAELAKAGGGEQKQML
jgi:hypothetical protein